jgi:coenzyme F420-0:L-glutamate ligase/coenzyme F420-1:gamma-L-glutamate ligase
VSSASRTPLVLTPLEGIPLIQLGDDLVDIILAALDRNQVELKVGDVLVLAQKIVSKAEGRQIDLNQVAPSPRALDLAEECGKDPRLVEMILRESSEVLRCRPGTIIVEHRLGFVCANAGIDRSNVPGKGEEHILLLPENPDRSAAEIRHRIMEQAGAEIGVMIIDSHGRTWRNGTVGTSIGISGMPGIVDLRGDTDLYGYQLKVTQVGAADELAAAASLVMGQAAEGIPVIHARGFPYPLREGSFRELPRDKELDLFR